MGLSQRARHETVIVLTITVHEAVDHLDAVAAGAELQLRACALQVFEAADGKLWNPVLQEPVPVPLVMIEDKLPEEPFGVVFPAFAEVPDEKGRIPPPDFIIGEITEEFGIIAIGSGKFFRPGKSFPFLLRAEGIEPVEFGVSPQFEVDGQSQVKFRGRIRPAAPGIEPPALQLCSRRTAPFFDGRKEITPVEGLLCFAFGIVFAGIQKIDTLGIEELTCWCNQPVDTILFDGSPTGSEIRGRLCRSGGRC